MMEMVREDILTIVFEIIWSRVTNKMVDTSTEGACQSK